MPKLLHPLLQRRGTRAQPSRRRQARSLGWLLHGLWALCAACSDASPSDGTAAPDRDRGSTAIAEADPRASQGASAAAEIAAEAPSVFGRWPDPLAAMPHGREHTAKVCARAGYDSVYALFCDDRADPTSLAELQAGLGVGTESIGGVGNLRTGNLTSMSVAGHSTALGKRGVSAINPRVIALRISFNGEFARDRDADAGVDPARLGSRMLAVGFARGEQFVEIIASDEAEKVFRFYVLGFRQACNASQEGCTSGDLLTSAIESNWTETTLYDEADLANTVLDCAPCHQPAGPGTHKLLRMQELDSPWTHWFSPSTEGGRALIQDYLAAHGDETYAGMTREQMAQADPNSLASLVFLDTPVQPNEFDSQIIEQEVKDSAASQGGAQPVDNSIPGMSETWNLAFERASRGEAIAVPFYNVKVTDSQKLSAMTRAYRAYREGELDARDLPDIRDVFPDDPRLRAQMGFGTMPGLDGADVLISACAQCHNGQLDQSLSRARFRADLVGMDRTEKDIAIVRMQLPPDNPLAMPPARLRELSAAARAQAIEHLR